MINIVLTTYTVSQWPASMKQIFWWTKFQAQHTKLYISHVSHTSWHNPVQSTTTCECIFSRVSSFCTGWNTYIIIKRTCTYVFAIYFFLQIKTAVLIHLTKYLQPSLNLHFTRILRKISSAPLAEIPFQYLRYSWITIPLRDVTLVFHTVVLWIMICLNSQSPHFLCFMVYISSSLAPVAWLPIIYQLHDAVAPILSSPFWFLPLYVEWRVLVDCMCVVLCPSLQCFREDYHNRLQGSGTYVFFHLGGGRGESVDDTSELSFKSQFELQASRGRP